MYYTILCSIGEEEGVRNGDYEESTFRMGAAPAAPAVLFCTGGGTGSGRGWEHGGGRQIAPGALCSGFLPAGRDCHGLTGGSGGTGGLGLSMV